MKPQDSQIHFCAVGRLAHGPKGTFHADGDRPPARPARSSTHGRARPSRARRRRSSCCAAEPTRSRSCSSSATPRRASWAASGCSPAAPSTRARARATPPTASRPCASSRRRPGSRVADPRALVKFSRWITPGRGQDALRHALLPRAAARRPGADDRRRRDRRPAAGSRPPARSRPTRAASIVLVFPTHQAPRAARAASPPPTSCSDYARGREVVPVQPRVVAEGETARMLLPGEPGYDD